MDEQAQTQLKPRATRVRQVTLPDGRTGWEYSDGAIRNDHGHMLKSLTGGQRITADNARYLLSRRHVVGLRAQLRGLAKAQGFDPADVDDDLLAQAGDAVEALTMHMAKSFQKSDSLRGMSEAYGALTAPLVGDRRQKVQDEPESEQPTVFVVMAQFIQQLAPTTPAPDDADPDVIEGEVKD